MMHHARSATGRFVIPSFKGTVIFLLTSFLCSSPARGGSLQEIVDSFDRTTILVQTGVRKDRTEAGVDLNISSLLANAGLQFRLWDNSLDSGSRRADIGLYAGVGLATVLQLQVAYSSQTGTGIRIRSDIPLTPTAGAWQDFTKGAYWVITPMIETTVTHDRGTLYSIGAGRTF